MAKVRTDVLRASELPGSPQSCITAKAASAKDVKTQVAVTVAARVGSPLPQDQIR